MANDTEMLEDAETGAETVVETEETQPEGFADPVDLRENSPVKPTDGPKERARKARLSKRKCSLPRPRSLKMEPAPFFKWAASFTDEQAGRSIFHVYRDWPCIDRTLIGEKKAKLIYQYFNERLPFTPENWEEYFLKAAWAGSGKYKIYCTEVGVKDTVALCKFNLDEFEFPPQVDPAVLIVGHPDNKGYLEGLRSKGVRIRGDNPEEFEQEEKEKEEMNVASNAMETLAKSNERLTDRVIGMLEQNNSGEDEDQAAEKKETESLGTTVLGSALRMVEKQVDRITTEQAKSYDPIAVAKSVIEMTKEMKGDQGGAAGMLAVMTSMMDSQAKAFERQITAAEKQNDFWRDLAIKQLTATPPAPPPTAEAKLTDQLEQLTTFKTLARELFGRQTSEREPAEQKPGILETIMANPALPQMINNGFLLLAQLLMPKVPGAPAVDQSQLLRQALNGNGSAAAPPPAPAEPTEQQRAQQMTLQFFRMIEKPFLAHFFDIDQQELSGYTFAHAMHCEFVHGGSPTQGGRQQYMMIRDQWGPKFDELIQQYPPIWQTIQGYKSTKYPQFLEEFRNYDQELERQQAEEPEPAKVTN